MNSYQKYKELKKIITFLISTSIIVGILLSFTFIRWETAKAADSGWWSDTTWDYSKKITIDHTKVDATLTNFPILVHITGDTDLGSHAQDDGDDILFTMDGDNETKLNHEIEYYNNDSGTVAADIWVNVTSLSSSADTVIWMYYGNAVAANQENVAGVWNSNYVLVLHLNETRSTDAGHYKDSTSYDNDGTLTDADSGVSRVSGMVAGCIDFDGDNPDHIAVPDDTELDITDSYTIEYWANLDTITGWKSVTGKWNTAAEKYHMYTGFYNNNLFFKQQCDGVDFVALGNDGLSTATWYYSVFQLDKTATDIRVYHNKTLDTTTNTGSYTSAQVTDDELWIGHPQAFAEPYDGEIDEFRLSNVAWNTSWLSATFNTIADNSNFVSVGNEQTEALPELTSLSCFPASGVDSYTTFYFNVTWTDAQDPTDGYLNVSVNRTGWSTNQSLIYISGTNSTGAIYSYSTLLTAGSYNYTFYAYDGTDYNSSGPHNNPVVNAQSYSFTVATASISGDFEFKDWTITSPGFIGSKTTEYNVSEDNQNATISAFNISNTGNVPINVTAKWLSDPGNPGADITIKYAESDSAPNPGVNTFAIDPSETQIIINLGPSDYKNIWLWLDFVDVEAQSDNTDIRFTSEIYNG